MHSITRKIAIYALSGLITTDMALAMKCQDTNGVPAGTPSTVVSTPKTVAPDIPPAYITVWPSDIIRHHLLPYLSDQTLCAVAQINSTFYEAVRQFLDARPAPDTRSKPSLSFKLIVLMQAWENGPLKSIPYNATISALGRYAAYADQATVRIKLFDLANKKSTILAGKPEHGAFKELWFNQEETRLYGTQNPNIDSLQKPGIEYVWNTVDASLAAQPRETRRIRACTPHSPEGYFLATGAIPGQPNDLYTVAVQNDEGTAIASVTFTQMCKRPVISGTYLPSQKKLITRNTIDNRDVMFNVFHIRNNAGEIFYYATRDKYAAIATSSSGKYHAFTGTIRSLEQNVPDSVATSMLNIRNWKWRIFQESAISLCFTADESQLLCGLNNGFIQIWRTETHNSPQILVNQSKAITSLATSNNNILISTSADNTVALYQFARLLPIETIRHRISCLKELKK